MSDDWRVRADLDQGDHVHHVLKGLHEHEIEHDVEDRLRDRLPVTASGTSVFVYAGDPAAADHAAEILRDVLADHELTGEVTIARWHPVEERWEAPDVPLPATPAETSAEHERLEHRQAEQSAEEGPQWEVRIDAGSHHEAGAIADRLTGEGLVPLRRWRHVFVSTATEDDANALAERLRGELPEGTPVIAEGTAADAWRATHPFAVLGGIAN